MSDETTYSISIYMDASKRILIIPYTFNEKGLKTSFDRYYSVACVPSEIGTALCQSIIDINAKPLIQSEDTIATWQIATGAKTWKAFTKAHTSIKVLVGKQSGYAIYPTTRNAKGAYVSTTEDIEIKLPHDASIEEIGSTVLKIFAHAS